MIRFILVVFAIVSIGAIAPVLFTLFAPITGCATSTTNFNSSLLGHVRNAAYLGTASNVADHPEWKPIFVNVLEELKVLEIEKVDSIRFLVVMRKLPVRELRGERTKIVIAPNKVILQDAVFNLYPLEQPNMKQVISAVRNGIELGLGI